MRRRRFRRFRVKRRGAFGRRGRGRSRRRMMRRRGSAGRRVIGYRM